MGLGPLGSAPPAHADGLDVIVDPIVNAILGSLTDSTTGLDLLLGIDPSTGLDLALPATDAAAASDPVAAAATAADPAASTSLASLYDTYIYDPSHTRDQSWIDGTTFLGSLTVSYDSFVNGFWTEIGGSGDLIGNGTAGTAADPTGAAGGLWFGDGGAGWNSDVAGDAGGATTFASGLENANTDAWLVPPWPRPASVGCVRCPDAGLPGFRMLS